jgi:hypothetical protein
VSHSKTSLELSTAEEDEHLYDKNETEEDEEYYDSDEFEASNHPPTPFRHSCPSLPFSVLIVLFVFVPSQWIVVVEEGSIEPSDSMSQAMHSNIAARFPIKSVPSALSTLTAGGPRSDYHFALLKEADMIHHPDSNIPVLDKAFDPSIRSVGTFITGPADTHNRKSR